MLRKTSKKKISKVKEREPAAVERQDERRREARIEETGSGVRGVVVDDRPARRRDGISEVLEQAVWQVQRLAVHGRVVPMEAITLWAVTI